MADISIFKIKKKSTHRKTIIVSPLLAKMENSNGFKELIIGNFMKRIKTLGGQRVRFKIYEISQIFMQFAK